MSIEQKKALHPYTSLWTQASAGTGKTKTLTDRVLSLLLHGYLPQHILCITFTKAAATEMLERIRKRLSAWVCCDETTLDKEVSYLLDRSPSQEELSKARELFTFVIDQDDGPHIETIHAFCQSLLKQFPLEAHLTPDFKIIDDQEKESLIEETQKRILTHNDERSSKISSSLGVMNEYIHELSFSDLIKTILHQRESISQALKEDKFEQLFPSKEEVKNNLLKDIDNLKSTADILLEGSKTEQKRGQELLEIIKLSKEEREKRYWDYVSLFLTGKQETSDRQIRKQLATKKFEDQYPGHYQKLFEEAQRVLDNLEHYKETITKATSQSFLEIARFVLELYQELKQNQNCLDYDDLILMTRDLLKDTEKSPWILLKLDYQIEHLLIDEAQDTSPLQWEIILSLVEDFFQTSQKEYPKTLFVVGDEKQSIYSFQGANINHYQKVKKELKTRVLQNKQLWQEVSLTKSYRSTKDVLALVDQTFSKSTAKDGVVIHEDDLTTTSIDPNISSSQPVLEHGVTRKEDGYIEIWPLMEPEPHDPPVAWKPAVENRLAFSPRQRLALCIAQRIQYYLKHPPFLKSKNRALQPSDIMILVRRRSGFVDELNAYLKSMHIPSSGIDRLTINDHIAVQDMIAFMRFFLLPQDDLSLACFLKSPIGGWNDDDLFDLCHDREHLSLWQKIQNMRNTKPLYQTTYDFINRFQQYFYDEGLYSFFQRLYNEKIIGHTTITGKQAFLSRLGQECEDVLTEFSNIVLNYESQHGPSKQLFLSWFDQSEIEVKRDLQSQNQDVVRIMTIHASKGLQAPIVFLPDTVQTPNKTDQLLLSEKNDEHDVFWIPKKCFFTQAAQKIADEKKEKQRHEYNRLLYVAMTRAEDMLFIGGWKSQREESDHSWYHSVKHSISEYQDTYKAEFSFDPSLGSILCIGKAPDVSTKEQKTKNIQKRAHLVPDWTKPAILSSPNNKQRNKKTSLTDQTSLHWGTVIHKLLLALPHIEQKKQQTFIHSYLKKNDKVIPFEKANRLSQNLNSIFSNPRYGRFFEATSKGELPLIGQLIMDGKEVTISGQIDRYYEDENTIAIIDYKSDQKVPTSQFDIPEQYQKQLLKYKMLLANKSPHKKIECFILWIMEPSLMLVDPDALYREAV